MSFCWFTSHYAGLLTSSHHPETFLHDTGSLWSSDQNYNQTAMKKIVGVFARVYLSRAIVLTFAFMTLGFSAQGCPEGWFGENCMLQCHCSDSTSCGGDGECPNNSPCMTGFFGPGCQYLDVLMKYAADSTESYLRDFDDTTCNPDENATFVGLSLGRALPFSWFRMQLIDDIDKEGKINFTTTLNDRKACASERIFFVSDTIVDVTCDVDFLVNKIRIEGPVAPIICTVYISGGRNVALKQRANQSSTYHLTSADQAKASNAVDGITDGKFESKHCSRTDVQKKRPSWTLKYNRPQILYLVRIYNRDNFQHQLQGFTLNTFGTVGQQISEVNDTSKLPRNIYELIISKKAAVISLTITQGKSFTGLDKVLTLCEVETYGDTLCPENTYGLFCNEMCYCNATEVCHSVTGTCAPECHAGFYGYSCSLSCSANCLFDHCDMKTGNCLQCISGYLGKQCDKRCASGTFGPQCSHACSAGCSETCNHTNGKCPCKTPYSGLLCTDCQRGWHGESCTRPCPTYCKERLCVKDTGDCVTCKVNRAGYLCKACAKPFFGQNCNKRCSETCLNRTCARRSGHCLACISGHRGYFCEYETTHTMFILIPLIIFLVIFCCCCRSSKAAVEAEK